MTFPFPFYCKHISLWLCLPNYSMQILINVLPFGLDTRTIFPVKLFSENRSNRTLEKTGWSYFTCVMVGSTINTADCWAAPGKLNTMQITSFHMQISPAYYACLQYINTNSIKQLFTVKCITSSSMTRGTAVINGPGCHKMCKDNC